MNKIKCTCKLERLFYTAICSEEGSSDAIEYLRRMYQNAEEAEKEQRKANNCFEKAGEIERDFN